MPHRTRSRDLSLTTLRQYQPSDHRRWAIGGTVIAATCFTLVALLAWTTEVPRDEPHAWLLTATAAACWAGVVMARFGNPYIGAAVACAALWIEVHASLAIAQAFPSAGLIATPVLSIASALIFGSRVALWTTLVSVAVTTPLYLLSPALRETGLSGPAVYWLGVHAAVSIASWGLMNVSLVALHRLVRSVEEREEDLALLVQQTPDGLLRIAPDGTVRSANPAARGLLRLDAAAVTNATLDAVLAAAGVVEAPRMAARVREHPDDDTPHRWLLPAMAGTRTVDVVRRRMPSGAWLLSLRDVTAQLEAVTVELEAAERRAHAQRLESLGQLAGGIAHDFNNLLLAFGGLLELTRAERSADERAMLLDELEAAQARGAALTRQLLAFARKDVVKPVRLDLAAHVRTSWRLLGRVAGEAVALRAQVVPPAWVLADATHIEQVLVNLVANARDAMPFGGTCTIAVSRDPADDLVQLVVEDTGHGMDAATRARAVEPFFTTKPRERGTGLGLATVHGIVQQSGGTLEIDSTPGVGTRIRITLPAAGADDAEPAAARDDAGEAPPHVLVLVVDDDETVRLTVSRLLARAGFAVDTAGDGAAALEILAAQPERHALVLTDVTMPIMGGKALAAEIGTRWPELPVLFMTGYAQQGFDDVPGFEAERDLIAKPFSSRELVQRVIERLGPRAAIG